MSKKTAEQKSAEKAEKAAAAKALKEEKAAAEKLAKENKAAASKGGKDVYVCSKLSQDQNYVKYKSGGGRSIPRKDGLVFIKGGSGVIGSNLDTPHGVVTRISQEDLDMVEKYCPGWKQHVDNGFLKVFKSDPTPKETKKIADDMPEDKSRQKTPEDIKTEKKDTDKK